MGFLDKRREKKEAAAADAAQRQQAAGIAAWDAWANELLLCIDLAKSGGNTAEDDTDGSLPLMLKKGEQVFIVGDGAGLVEPRRLPGQWVGRSQGASFRVAKGVSYRIGGNRGTYQQGEEVPTAIDFGMVTITDQRVVFQGAKQTREWVFSKLIGFQHDPVAPITYLQVSNRQKTSGILYDETTAATMRLRLAVALAWADGDASEIIPTLEELIEEHKAAQPPTPARELRSPST